MRKYTRLPDPAYAPELLPGLRNELEEIRRVARACGYSELQPWQEFVLERATQYRVADNGERIYQYSRVMVTVPRQSGKTTMLIPLRMHRMLTKRRARLFSTAQTGKAARDRMLQAIDIIEESPLGGICRANRSNGGEGITIPALRSQWRSFAPVEQSVHGDTPDLVDFDEIWKYSETLGNALVAAASPSQVTLFGRSQLWFISTMGTRQSGFMNMLVKRGRENTDKRMAYFEWSLPAGRDPYDEAAWWEFHPALGNTISIDALRDEVNSGMPESDWLRAYCNRLTEADRSLVPMDVWRDMQRPADMELPPLSSVGIGVDVAPQTSCAAIVAAWRDSEGTPYAHVLHQAPGARWLVPYVEMLRARYDIAPVMIDNKGPARRFIEPLGEHCRVADFKARAIADQTLIAAARDDETLRHDGSAALTSAQAAAVARRIGGEDLLDRDKSTAPIPSLIAAGLALYAHDYPPEQIDVLQAW